MKKNLLAVSIAAALGLGAGAASAVTVANNGIGHTNIIPYFSVQNGNMTLLSITNTDLVNGKAVKVRFRGAEWSDDIFDFQVFLSPGDVFTGAVTQNGSLANFVTSDGTCTLPSSVNQDFVPIRLQNPTTGTLEGYIEIITMADIVNTNPATGYDLFKATKHVNGVAPCKSAPEADALLNGLKEENPWQITVTPVAQVPWMLAPTGSLTSYATIINVNNSKAFANVATAVNYTAPVEAYFEQANVALTPTVDHTADRIFYVQAGANTGADVPMYQFDMPDLSTNIENLVGDAVAERDALSMVLQKSGFVAEYSTLAALDAASDIVISQPTRRYFYNYTLDTLTPELTIEGVGYDIDGDVGTPYAALVGSTNRVPLAGGAKFYDREERAAGSNIVISPTPPGGTLSLKGEVSVIGINNGAGATGALGALLTINDITAVGSTGTFQEGWASISTNTGAVVAAPYLNANLAVIGFSAQNAFNANAGSAGTNYGTTLPLRYY